MVILPTIARFSSFAFDIIFAGVFHISPRPPTHSIEFRLFATRHCHAADEWEAAGAAGEIWMQTDMMPKRAKNDNVHPSCLPTQHVHSPQNAFPAMLFRRVSSSPPLLLERPRYQ